jgi:hypothetical protein
LHFSPRFLVETFPAPPPESEAEATETYEKALEESGRDEASWRSKVEQVIRNSGGAHFDVETQASGPTEEGEGWVEQVFLEDPRRVLFTFNDTTPPIPTRFGVYFAEMLGVDRSTYESDPQQYHGVVRPVLPYAIVSRPDE